MYYRYCIILVVAFLIMGCQSTQKGGALPKLSNQEIRVDVLNIDWSDLSLAPGDRRIKGTGFVVANWSSTPNNVGVYFGAIGAIVGVLASDIANEQKLQDNVETALKDNFDLAKIMLNSLNRNQDLLPEIHSFELNANLKRNVITLEPWCIITTSENGLVFIPQLKATLRSESGKSLWEGNYGPMSTHKAFKLDASTTSENISALQTRLDTAYEEITHQLIANIQGQHSYESKDAGQKYSNDLMKTIEIDINK